MSKIRKYLESCTSKAGVIDGVSPWVFPGASWATGNSKSVFEMGSVGLLGVDLAPVTENSLYDLASLTKLPTTLALMKQLEDGLICLADEVGYFLPSYKNSPYSAVTLFALLTHTAPLTNIASLYKRAHNKEEMLEVIRSSEPRPDSSGKVLYTCEAFILLGEIISVVDSSPLDEIIRRRVLEPLGMIDTCFNPPPSLLDRIAPTEECPWRNRLVRGEVHDENAVVMGGVSGNAGLFSSVVDMSRFAAAMLASLEGGGFLKKASACLMTHNYTAGKGQNRGLGWMIADTGSSSGDFMSLQSFGHTGFTGTSLWIDPERKLYTLLLANRIYPNRNNVDDIYRTRCIFSNLAVLEYGD
ncbi:MAG: beta-lactamase family protein [Treponema sp.]|jgi:CubicO group peptidase (beta-lactamase class C family)|nr:beta-lactamase family protein [Treponema sp.]